MVSRVSKVQPPNVGQRISRWRSLFKVIWSQERMKKTPYKENKTIPLMRKQKAYLTHE